MTERIRLACGCEIIRHEGIAATERVYCAQHGEAEATSLFDERMYPVRCPTCGEVWAEENQGIGEAECPACWTRRIATERGERDA